MEVGFNIVVGNCEEGVHEFPILLDDRHTWIRVVVDLYRRSDCLQCRVGEFRLNDLCLHCICCELWKRIQCKGPGFDVRSDVMISFKRGTPSVTFLLETPA